MNYLLKAYTYKYIRIPIKFMISLMIVKGIGDAFYYCIFGTTVTLPRCVIEMINIEFSINRTKPYKSSNVLTIPIW